MATTAKPNKMMTAVVIAVWFLVQLTSPAASCPDLCSCSGADVSCDNRGLTSIPDNIPNTTTYLDLDDNAIQTMKNSAFIDLPNLSYLEGNDITTFDSGTFSGLSSLSILDLHNNDIVTIASGAFGGLGNLWTLNLDDNNVDNIDNGTFIGLSRLRNLYLRNNGISNIINGAFKGLSRLYVLFLSNNTITNINSDIFTGLFNIQHLNLDFNPIANINGSSFSGLVNLQHLFLENSGIRHIGTKTFSNLLNLRTLYLDENPLNLTDDPFVDMPKLRVISLVRCKLTAIPTLPPSIESIHLGGNPIQAIQSGDFANLRSLEDPDICNQYVATKADYRQIDEHYNRDPYYYDYYYYYDDGYYYYYDDDDNCDYSRSYKNASDYPLITVAKGAYTNLDQLSALTLRGNGIIYVSPGAFVNLLSLKDLDLSYNEITYLLPDTFVNVPRLRFLYLHGNKLTALPSDLFGTLPKLEKVSLYNNPWTCDCWLQGLVQWMKTTGVAYESRSPVTCTSSPAPYLLNVSLSQVDPQALICEQTTTPQIAATSDTITKSEEDTIPSPTRNTVVTVTPRLFPPRAVALVTTTATESIVQWKSPSTDVMGYIISYVKTKGGRIQWTQPIHPGVKVYNILNLSPGTAYHVCVIAQYPVGRSAATNNPCVTATTKEGAGKGTGTGTDQTLVIGLASAGVIAAVVIVGTIVMCKVISCRKEAVNPPPLTLNGERVERVRKFKLLGVIVSDDLSWGPHIDYILSKVRPRLHYLRLSKRAGLPADVLLDIYKAFIRPVLEYGSPVWGGLPRGLAEELEKVQRSCCRIISIPYEQLPTLESRRREATTRELRRVVADPTHPCHQFLQPATECQYQLRRAPRFKLPLSRSNRHSQSFIPRALAMLNHN
ncbi:IGFALS [Branchiostoma lanceolatum]|uniref:IGFALS protein n=1 Tax=Branchiostoma lanceolatum TaxID=7740 RepID=A0A8K0EM53_BRALA|nr:IGFALS [Branchiostoma lanceolatum]